MGAIENIGTNAKARLLARTDVSTLWTADNVVIVGGEVPVWPQSEYAVRLTVGSGTPGPGQIIRGSLTVEVARRVMLDDARDQTVLTQECLTATRDVHRALARSYLNGALDEGLEFRSVSRPVDISREQGGGEGAAVACTLEYRWGVDWGTDHIPKGDDGTGVDRGGVA